MKTNDRTPDSQATSERDGFRFCHYVVAVIDFLGQATQLSKWGSLPNTPSEKASFVIALRGTFGRVMAWRRAFEAQFNTFLTEYQPPGLVVIGALDGGEAFRRFQETSVGFFHFSDTIVVYSPLENRHGHLSLGGIYGFIVICGTLMLAALNQGTVFRGGIEIGMAGRFPHADLYGPALAKAHHLESRIAQYPRIVIGPALVSYLRAHLENPEDSMEARANRGTASLCLRLLAQDTDGCHIIDYLGDQFTSLGATPTAWLELRSGAYGFVQRELARFTSAGDEKLTVRYRRLLDYFGARGFPVGAPM